MVKNIFQEVLIVDQSEIYVTAWKTIFCHNNNLRSKFQKRNQLKLGMDHYIFEGWGDGKISVLNRNFFSICFIYFFCVALLCRLDLCENFFLVT